MSEENQNLAQWAIKRALQCKRTFCKFLSANDTGETKAHQAGIYISKPSVPILFDHYGEKGQNMDRWVKIRWQNDLITDTRFIYYGRGTRNEYRITNFGRDFPYLRSEYTGALFILIQVTSEDYEGYILNTDDDIQAFLDAFGLTPTQTNRIIEKAPVNVDQLAEQEIQRFIAFSNEDFPSSEEMSFEARALSYISGLSKHMAVSDPDNILLKWTDFEYRLFRAFENARYGAIIRKGFDDVDSFALIANQVLNRRKSRAGKSLEHHLASIFDSNNLKYTPQAKTEGNKRPDFLFPSEEAYHDADFDVNNLITLAAKTTCKDRWRQIINEANRRKKYDKYLCTLQQGISIAQMDEMAAEKVILVVPRPFIDSYPKERRDRIWTIKKFIDFVREKEGL